MGVEIHRQAFVSNRNCVFSNTVNSILVVDRTNKPNQRSNEATAASVCVCMYMRYGVCYYTKSQKLIPIVVRVLPSSDCRQAGRQAVSAIAYKLYNINNGTFCV